MLCTKKIEKERAEMISSCYIAYASDRRTEWQVMMRVMLKQMSFLLPCLIWMPLPLLSPATVYDCCAMLCWQMLPRMLRLYFMTSSSPARQWHWVMLTEIFMFCLSMLLLTWRLFIICTNHFASGTKQSNIFWLVVIKDFHPHHLYMREKRWLEDFDILR